MQRRNSLFRATIVLVAFPVVVLLLNTPFYGVSILINRIFPNPSPTVAISLLRWIVASVWLVVVLGGALYACWLMWRKLEHPN